MRTANCTQLMIWRLCMCSSFAEFKEKFTAAGAPGAAFGSGWMWLVMKDGDKKLSIEFTPNAENPLSAGSGTPLVTYDVWVSAPKQ